MLLLYLGLGTVVLASVELDIEKDGLCVKQPNNKLLPIHAYTDDNNNTPQKCTEACSYKGYKFAGVKWSKECWCGNTKPSHDKYTTPTECDMPCTGDNNLVCGGGYALNLYKTVELDIEKDGLCVEQPNNKLLPIHAYTDDNNNTPQKCTEACSYKGYKFAGVKWSKECWCGNTKPSRDKYTAPTECDMPCTGNQEQMCGGANVLNLYRTNVEDLFLQEMRAVLNDDKMPTERDPKMVKHMEKYLKFPSLFLKSPVCQEILVPAFIKLVNNPQLSEFFPDYASFFQMNYLPSLIQDASPDSPLLKSVLPTEFPPAVDSSVKTKNKKVTIVNPTISHSHNYTAMAWRGRSHWISTGVYAKQGEVVTMRVPTRMIGKFIIRVNAHSCNLHQLNLNRWIKKEKKWQRYRPALLRQYYEKSLIKEETKILTPYGGLIYVKIDLYNTFGDFDLDFNNVIESARFVYGVSTNEQWARDYEQMPAPMVELEVPGLIFTIPKLTMDSIDTDMAVLAQRWKIIMEAVFDLQGFVPDRAMRYVTDVENDVGSAHALYPIMHSHLPRGFFDSNHMEDSRDLVVALHEIGHNLQDPRYTMGPDFVEVTNRWFIKYVYDELFDGHNPDDIPGSNWTSLNTVIFRNQKKAKKVGKWLPYEHVCYILTDNFGWEPFKQFFRYYLYHVPPKLSPNTQEYSLSLMVKIFSKVYNKNLVPFFQWFNWPVLNDTIEETKNLPEWKGIFERLENVSAKCVHNLAHFNFTSKPCCEVKGELCGEGERRCTSDSQCKEGLTCIGEEIGPWGKWGTCNKG